MTLTGITPATVPLSGGPQHMAMTYQSEAPAPQVVPPSGDAQDTGSSTENGSRHGQHGEGQKSSSAPPSIMQMKIDAMLREQAAEMADTQTGEGSGPPDPAAALPLTAPA